MRTDQTLARTLHDIGAAAWFGGALMGVVGLDGAAAATPDDRTRLRAADAGWQAWQPWKTAAIASHVAGSLALLWGNKGRLAGQRGAMAVNLAKTGVFAAALGADVYAAWLGREVARQPAGRPAGEADESSELSAAPEDTRRRLRVVQWVVPALTGLNIVLAARMGEQQRPTNVVAGLAQRLRRRA